MPLAVATLLLSSIMQFTLQQLNWKMRKKMRIIS